MRVKASGFGSVERIHHVSVRGGDGRSHQVPVRWDEYFDVENSVDMLVQETAPSDEASRDATNDDHQRPIRPACLLPGFVVVQHPAVLTRVGAIIAKQIPLPEHIHRYSGDHDG